MNHNLSAQVRAVCLLLLLVAQASCRTIAYFDENTFQRTAELRAKTLVLLDHGNEDYAQYASQVDEVRVMSEALYSMQQARSLNFVTQKQWDIMLKTGPVGGKPVLTSVLETWRERKKLSPVFVQEMKGQLQALFDEILKLEGSKLKDNKR